MPFLHLRASELELAVWRTSAERAGATLSEYVRSALAGVAVPPRVTRSDLELLEAVTDASNTANKISVALSLDKGALMTSEWGEVMRGLGRLEEISERVTSYVLKSGQLDNQKPGGVDAASLGGTN
jgi:hypothetical protein